MAPGKARPTSLRPTDLDRARADIIMDAGLADSFSDAVRVALAVAVKVVDLITATMGVL